jgi:hypothetical protein
MTQKALLQSAGDGTAVPAGYVGETLSNTTTTTITTSFQNLVSITLNKGYWLVFGYISAGSSSNCLLQARIAVSGSQVGFSPSSTIVAGLFGQVSLSRPVLITSDATTVSIQGQISAGTGTSGAYELFAVRIA